MYHLLLQKILPYFAIMTNRQIFRKIKFTPTFQCNIFLFKRYYRTSQLRQIYKYSGRSNLHQHSNVPSSTSKGATVLCSRSTCILSSQSKCTGCSGSCYLALLTAKLRRNLAPVSVVCSSTRLCS